MNRFPPAALCALVFAAWCPTPGAAAEPPEPRKHKILVLESLPRYDFKFAQRALLRDRRADPVFFLTEGDLKVMRSGPPWLADFTNQANGVLKLDRKEFRTLLFEFDLLVVGDVPAAFFTREHQEVITEFVTDRGGKLVVAAGRRHAPASFVGTPLGELLPVEVKAVKFAADDVRGEKDKFAPILTAAGARSGLFRDRGDEKSVFSEIYWHYPVEKAKPAAAVFAAHPTQKGADGKPMPVIAGYAFGKGYVLFVGHDEFWRGRFNNGVDQLDLLTGLFRSDVEAAVVTAAADVLAGLKR